ncbi:MAG: biotin--[acetyl-CoA-carboxylase] ligase [Spirochaetales bacterium]|nr:biotin--[acetyl-CoA-carboxylase] ligase [Spirochaetales bacterium]
MMQILPFVSPWNNAPIYYCPATTSTMKDAELLLKDGCTHGTVIATDFQSQGRGRFSNRKWESAKAQNLLFTVILKKRSLQHAKILLPLLTGLAVALAIEKLFSLNTQIKWPNDVLIKEKKVAGILCTAKKDAFLIGVGINCNQRRFSPNQAQAASLAWFLNRHVDRTALLHEILSGLKAVLSSGEWLSHLEKRLFLNGKKCRILFHQQSIERAEAGTILGIGPRGELRFKPDAGETVRLLISGEVQTFQS